MSHAELTQVRAMLSGLGAGMELAALRNVYDGVGGQFPPPDDVTPRAEQIGGLAGEWTSTPAAAADQVAQLHCQSWERSAELVSDTQDGSAENAEYRCR